MSDHDLAEQTPAQETGPDLDSPFKYEDGNYLIELRLSTLDQFFNTFDPSPFHDKDIDEDAERYIVDSVRSFPLRTPLKMVFYLPPEHTEAASRVLSYSIDNYFGFRAKMTGRELHAKLHEGRVALLFGLLFLFLCTSARGALLIVFKSPFAAFMLEGLSIIGWVAMWRPIQILLYDWWSISRMRKVYVKIRDMPMEIRIE